MISKSLKMLTLATVVGIGLVATSSAFVTAESGEMISEKKSNNPPRYSETCAHGHNGFDCKLPSYRADITDLQERVTALEKNTSRP